MAQKATNRIRLKLTIKKGTPLNYSRILGASKIHKRSSTKLKESEENLIIEISATDIAALRASSNSILRDIQVIEATGAPQRNTK